MLPTIDNSVILFIAWRAYKMFDGDDGIFDSDGFAVVLKELLGIPLPDRLIVKLILSGRPGIRQVGETNWFITSFGK